MTNNEAELRRAINQTTAREYWESIEMRVRRLTNDESEIKENTKEIVNVSFNHYVQYFARQPEYLKSYNKEFPLNQSALNGGSHRER